MKLGSHISLSLFLLVLSCVTSLGQESRTEGTLQLSAEASVYFNQGVEQQKARKYNEAIESYQKAIKAQPNYVPSHVNLGISYAQLNRFEESITAFRQALKL